MSQQPPAARSAWQHAFECALDLLYPPVCALCNARLTRGRGLCDACDAALPRLAAPFCQTCGEMFSGQIAGAFACPNCRDLQFAFEFARPAMVRDDQTLELIHRLKYQRDISLATELGRLASEAFADPRLAPALAGCWPMVPVPLHRRRLQYRHFNQAEEIARELARHTGLPILRALRRIRRTDTQTRLTRKQRMANLRGAFAVTRQGRRWIEATAGGAVLIDDVFTTGSTVHECADTLRRAGFRKVVVVTVMRG